jgi:heme A synthase
MAKQSVPLPARPARPARAVLTLVLTIVLGLGVAAYLVNMPVLWIAVVELVALIAIAGLVSRARRAEPVTGGASSGEPRSGAQ